MTTKPRFAMFSQLPTLESYLAGSMLHEDDTEIKSYSATSPGYILYIGKELPVSRITMPDHVILNIERPAMAYQFLTTHHDTDDRFPEAILVDTRLTPREIYKFQHSLQHINGMAQVPFLIIALSDDIQSYKTLVTGGSADDIVRAEIGGFQLVEKIRTLKKLKRLVQKETREDEDILGNLIHKIDFCLKRVLDIVISFASLLILSPVMLLIIILIRLESRGPVFYISPRAGKGYKVFPFYKFRTMVCGADKKLKDISHLNQYHSDNDKGPVFLKVKNDPRITRVGAFLRNTSLDELPQLINVLKGDMSLVGNRPLPLYEASTLTTDLCSERFHAPAGITGLWQISKRGKGNMSAQERVNLDIAYAHKKSFFLDIWIIARTPRALIQKEDV